MGRFVKNSPELGSFGNSVGMDIFVNSYKAGIFDKNPNKILRGVVAYV
jgi:hypothetical protein